VVGGEGDPSVAADEVIEDDPEVATSRYSLPLKEVFTPERSRVAVADPEYVAPSVVFTHADPPLGRTCHW
jgi:hypothetical protein